MRHRDKHRTRTQQQEGTRNSSQQERTRQRSTQTARALPGPPVFLLCLVGSPPVARSPQSPPNYCPGQGVREQEPLGTTGPGSVCPKGLEKQGQTGSGPSTGMDPDRCRALQCLQLPDLGGLAGVSPQGRQGNNTNKSPPGASGLVRASAWIDRTVILVLRSVHRSKVA